MFLSASHFRPRRRRKQTFIQRPSGCYSHLLLNCHLLSALQRPREMQRGAEQRDAEQPAAEPAVQR